MAFSVAQILNWAEGRIVNFEALDRPVEQILVERPAPLAHSVSSDLAYFFSREYRGELPLAMPGVLITSDLFVKPLEAASLPLWKKSAVVVCSDPYRVMGILSEKFAEKLSSAAHLSLPRETQIHPTAVLDPSAQIGENVEIGAHCVVEAGAQIGRGSVLYPGCYVGKNARLGEGCVLFPRVTLYECVELGNRVRIHSGTVIGSDGFGYAPIRSVVAGQNTVIGHQKIYHLGRVLVGDDVEMGAVCSIDRGTLGDTVIARFVKLDNQVHVGHNARIEEGAVICGGTCLAGRASVGRYAYVGGLSGIANGVHVGDAANVGALALMTKDVPAGSAAVGNPQREYHEHFRLHAKLNRWLKTKASKASEES